VHFSTTSCATLFQGTNEEIDIASDPAAANVTVNDGRSGVTPFSIKENRDSDVQVHFSKPGYEPYDVSDASHVKWGYVVSDIFFTGLIGLGVDGIDGAMFEHSNKMVSAHLEPVSSPIASAPVSSALTAASAAPSYSAAPAATVVSAAAHASDMPE
jgi:hypothetical protein